MLKEYKQKLKTLKEFAFTTTDLSTVQGTSTTKFEVEVLNE